LRRGRELRLELEQEQELELEQRRGLRQLLVALRRSWRLPG
jgi:hypothetical protein